LTLQLWVYCNGCVVVKLCSAEKEAEISLTVMLNNYGILTSKITCMLILVRMWWNCYAYFWCQWHNSRPWDRE